MKVPPVVFSQLSRLSCWYTKLNDNENINFTKELEKKDINPSRFKLHKNLKSQCEIFSH